MEILTTTRSLLRVPQLDLRKEKVCGEDTVEEIDVTINNIKLLSGVSKMFSSPKENRIVLRHKFKEGRNQNFNPNVVCTVEAKKTPSGRWFVTHHLFETIFLDVNHKVESSAFEVTSMEALDWTDKQIKERINERWLLKE